MKQSELIDALRGLSKYTKSMAFITTPEHFNEFAKEVIHEYKVISSDEFGEGFMYYQIAGLRIGIKLTE